MISRLCSITRPSGSTSTGTVTLTHANTSATDYTVTVQAATGTVALVADITGGTRAGSFTTLAASSAITASTTIELGHASDTTLSRVSAGVAAIEGAHRSIAVQSGLAAVTGAIVGFLKTGDHMLVTDNAYGPARRFANTTLKGFGVETTYFDPMIGGEGLAKLMRPNTKVVYLEAPGSQTFEVQDVDGMAAVAKKGGKGKWILLLGALAAGAAVMAWRKSNERPDPWDLLAPWGITPANADLVRAAHIGIAILLKAQQTP